MAQPAIDTTVGGASANSYCTRAEADSYHDQHLYGDTWKSAEAYKKDMALIWATRLLDEQVEWKGERSTRDQALRWPRWYVYDRDGYALATDAIPTFLKNATAELARYLLTEDRTAERSYGIKSVQADVVSVEFNPADQKPILPQSVRTMVEAYGTVTGPGSGYAKLLRA